MMHRDDSHSASPSRRLLAFAAIAATAATVVLAAGFRPPHVGPASSSASAPTSGGVWSHDDSVPETADTLSHERLADEEPAATF
jgi:hypothetical protein